MQIFTESFVKETERMLNVQHYEKNSQVSLSSWDKIADYLATCDNNEEHCVYDKGYGDYYARDEELISFQSLLQELAIPEKEWPDIENEIRCPVCNSKIKLSDNVSIDITFKAKRDYQKRIETINKKVKQKLDEFVKFLQEYPLLGMTHEIGKTIAGEIKGYPRIKIEKSIWFKARNIDKGNVSKIFTQEDMDQVPAEYAKEERYSHNGQSALYVGNHPLVCLSEINNGCLNGICWMQKFQIEVNNIIDLTPFMISDSKIGECPLFIAGILINGLTTEKNEVNSNGYYKPEYVITRFIADLCRENGIKGIKYPSASFKIQDSDDSFNLVLFGDTSEYKEFIDEPYIFNGKEYIVLECKMDGCDTVIQFIIKETTK